MKHRTQKIKITKNKSRGVFKCFMFHVLGFMKKGFTPTPNGGKAPKALKEKPAPVLVWGFTVIEVTVTISILIIVIVAVLAITFLGQRFYQRGEVRAEILQNGRIVSERIAREIRQADELVTQLPQVPDLPGNPPSEEIEFQDGHTPSPYAYLGSEYYYVRYYIATSTNEVHREYMVYCFDDCGVCSEYFRWNDTKMEGEVEVGTSSCQLEDRIIGEYVQDMNFWGASVINISLTLQKDSEQIDLNTKVLGRNL